MKNGAERLFLGATLLAPGQGGIARVARMTARALAEKYANVEVLSYLDKDEVEISGANVRSARGSRLAYLAQCHLAALRNSHCIYDSVGAARAHPRFGWPRRPFATWIHGIEVWHDRHRDRTRVLKESGLVLVNSQFTLDRYRSLRGDLDGARVCWLATEEDDPPEAAGAIPGPPTVLMVGRIDAGEDYKGHREMISIWPRVVAVVPAARLVIADAGSGFGTIVSLARSSPVAGSIEMKGFVPDESMPALWRQASVFAMPSRNEGFGIVYAEAMRYSLPLIASVHDAASEVNVEGGTGYNADLDRPGELEERLIHLLRNPDIAESLGQASQERWRRHFRYSAFRQRLEHCLNGFLPPAQT